MKRFLYLFLAVTMMVLVNFEVFAEDEDPFLAGRAAATSVDPNLVQNDANSKSSTQGGLTEIGGSAIQQCVLNGSCPMNDLPGFSEIEAPPGSSTGQQPSAVNGEKQKR